MSDIRIVSAVIDTRELTLYKDTGERITIPQGDPRVRTIIDTVLPVLDSGGTATVDLSTINEFSKFEENSKGLIRFFRVAKQTIKNIFSGNDTEPVAPTGSFGAIKEIMAQAQPMDHTVSRDSTVVAIVGDKAIPGMEEIKDHFRHSNTTGSTKGMEAFLRRLGSIIDQRGHTVDELLKFLNKADLPIADDGSIIAYKRLYSTEEEGVYVDPHTRKVKQKIGSYVCMDQSLVDPDKRTECSQGLHIGRRDYISSFYGDTICITKIAPEDVIAVPYNEPSKMRVMGYHVLFKLDPDLYELAARNQSITKLEKGQELLARALSGDHPERFEEVRITGTRGTGMVITPLDNGNRVIPVLTSTQSPEKPAKASSLDDIQEEQAKAINPREINEKLLSSSLTNSKEKPVAVPRKEQARLLMNTMMSTAHSMAQQKEAAKALLGLKKASKVSWGKLGVYQAQIKLLEALLADEPAPVRTSKKTKAVSRALKGTKEETPSPKPNGKVTSEADLSSAQKTALDFFRKGDMTKAEIARKTGVSTRTLGRLIDKFGC